MLRMKSLLAGCTVAAGILAAAAVAHAERYVVVNGQRLNLDQIVVLEQVHCGPIPNGNYWLDTSSGQWGYAGGGVQGNIRDNCYNPGPRPGLSQRGMLFSPHDWTRDTYRGD